jgi:Arc/MetJ family transcription regulator
MGFPYTGDITNPRARSFATGRRLVQEKGASDYFCQPLRRRNRRDANAQKYHKMVYSQSMRTNIDIDERLVRKARKLTRLKSKRQIVDKALELLVRSESRKGILRYYGSGIWKGDPKAMRKNRV